MTCPPTDDHQFSEAAAVLLTWVDRGEVTRRTSNQFYSMIQSANSHVRRLMIEKAQEEEEVERAKEAYKKALLAVLTQCKNTPSQQQSDNRQPGRPDTQVSSDRPAGGAQRGRSQDGREPEEAEPGLCWCRRCVTARRWAPQTTSPQPISLSSVSMTTLLHPFPHQIHYVQPAESSQRRYIKAASPV